MKTIVSVAIVAILTAPLFTSCTKNQGPGESSNFCICGYRNASGKDTLQISEYGYSPEFSGDAAAKQCALRQDTLQSTYPGIICDLEALN